MDVGNKIASLRKKHHLSQEDLAEKVGVTRQTISKWELGETTPDIQQALNLSKIFDISLDELMNNDMKESLVGSINNTEKLAGMIIKILKFIGIGLLVMFVLDIIILIIFLSSRMVHLKKERTITGKYVITCHIEKEEYLYELEYNKNYQVIYGGGDAFISDHTDVEKYEDANKAKAHIEDWFKDHRGSCHTVEENK